MKKLLIMFVALLATVSLYAQGVEQLIKKYHKADPMLDNVGYTSWSSKHVQIIKEDGGDTYIEIRKPAHVFIDEESTKIGFYDRRGKLITISEFWYGDIIGKSVNMNLHCGFLKDSIQYVCPIPQGTIKTRIGTHYSRASIKKYKYMINADDVLKFLNERTGYIRIVTSTYGGGVFDVKAKMN